MKKILANDEAFQIQSGSGGVLTAPNVESGEKIIATQDWVDDEINKVSAYYITSNAQGDTFATEQALNAGPWFSGGQTRNPTRNDYAIVSDGTPARYIVTTVSEQGVPTWVKQYDISSDYDARNLSDLDKVYETWEEPLVGDGNRASNHCLIHFKPSVFGVSGNCVIRQFTIRTSNTETPSNAKVYAKLFLESDPSASLATSRPVKITAQDAYFTFTFDTDATLDSETWYNLTFHLGAEDTSETKNVGLRLTGNFGVQQDIYYDGAPTYRPIVKVLFAPTDDKVAYKADAKLNDTWKCTPSTYEGQEIAIEVQENSGAKSLVLMVDGSAIGTAKPMSDGVSKVTWAKGTDWPGDEDLVAKLSYVLGNQDRQKLQPSGDYLTEDDFDSVEVLDFNAEKISVKDGGSLELGMNATVNVKKGANDPKIVVEEGSTTHELDIPSLSGTIAVKEDVFEELDGKVVTWEDNLDYNDQASGFRALKFKPRAFDMPSESVLKSITLTSSRSVEVNAEVYIKLTSADGQTTYAISDSQNMDTKNKAYTFTFDGNAKLDADTEYQMLFFLAGSDPETAQGVNLNLMSTQESPDLYLVYGERKDLRPKAVAVYKKQSMYAKHEETRLTETYGSLNESKWATSPRQINGYDISIRLIESQGAVKAAAYANNQIVAMTPITITDEDRSITWNPMGGERPFWFGNVPLVATRIGKHFVLGDQTDKKIQPMDDFLVEEDLQKAYNKIAIQKFNQATNYAVGDHVVYVGNNNIATVYRCTTAHVGLWNAEDFTRIFDLIPLAWEPGEPDGSAVQVQSGTLPIDTGTTPREGGSAENTAISGLVTVEGAGNRAGLRGYRYTNSGTVTNTLTFEVVPEGWEPGDVVTVINKAKYPNAGTIQSISDTTVTFESNLEIGSIVEESDYDSKCAYVQAKPELGNVDLGYGAHSEGIDTDALNTVAHSEGYKTQALGEFSHTEGRQTKALYASHAEGKGTEALGQCSHSQGYYTIALNNYEHAEGCLNASHTGTQEKQRTRHSIGIGTDSNHRKNALEVMVSGDMYILNLGGYNGTNPEEASSIQTILNDLTGWFTSNSIAAGTGAKAGYRAVAIGNQASAYLEGVSTTGAMAIGNQAKAHAEGACQIGWSSSANTVANSLRFHDTQIVNGSGKIVSSNLDSDTTPTEGSSKTVTSDGVAKAVKKFTGYTTTWQDDINYNDQSAGIQKLLFKPRAFEMPDGAYINKMTLTNSPTTSTANEIVLKLMSVDEQTVYATSDAQNMNTQGQAYTFTFNTKYGLLKDTEYLIRFYLASTGAAVNVSLKLKSGTDSPDLHLNTNRLDLRPKAVVEWGMDGAYLKPTNGIPKSDLSQEVQNKLDGAYQLPSSGIPKDDLASGVQSSLDKADSAAQPEDVQLKESYGDPMDSEWTLNQTTIQGNDITLQITQDQTGAVKVTPWSGGSPIADTGITITDKSETITWNPMGGQSPFWAGSEPLVGTRVGNKFYVLGNQKEMGLQPAGDYLSKEDLDAISVRNFTSEAIEVKDGGTITFKPGSSIQVIKGANEAKIVIDDGNTTKEVSFPEKNGTLAVDTDLVGYISKAALASVLDAVDAETGTDAKFNALITGLRNLVNA